MPESVTITQARPDPRDYKSYYLCVTPTRRILQPTLIGIFRLLGAVHVEGAEKLPSLGAVIVAANHMTNFDVIPLQTALSRPIFFMGKEELFRNSLLDWAFRQLGAFPVYRGLQDAWAIQHAERVLQNGLVLGMFPEGTRSHGRGLQPAKTGAARLALASHCPVIPVGIHGTREVLRHFPRRARVDIRIGDPIYPLPTDTPASLTDRMMFALASLLPQATRGVYRLHPSGF